MSITLFVTSQKQNSALKVTAPSSSGLGDRPVIVGATIFNKMEEIWKDVVEYEGRYQVSSNGRVRSLKRRFKKRLIGEETILRLEKHKQGYLRIMLSKDELTKKFLVHRLVAQAFLPNIENKTTVNHINGIKDDNRTQNLEWATQTENIRHAILSGLKPATRGERSGTSKLTEKDVLEIRKLYHEEGVRAVIIGERFGIGAVYVCTVANKKVWKHVV